MITLENIKTRLSQFGYTPTETDDESIEFEIKLIINYVINYCNFNSEEDIPELLTHRIIDRICGEYLRKKKNAGILEGFDYDTVVKTIKEGDTQIQFGTSNDGETPESRFDDLVNYLERGFDKWISQWRRIKW